MGAWCLYWLSFGHNNKVLGQKTRLRGRGFMLVHGLRTQVFVAEKSWWWQQEAAYRAHGQEVGVGVG